MILARFITTITSMSLIDSTDQTRAKADAELLEAAIRAVDQELADTNIALANAERRRGELTRQKNHLLAQYGKAQSQLNLDEVHVNGRKI